MHNRSRRIAAFSFLAFVAALFPGCGASEVSCSELCSCQEKSGETCETECTKAHGEQKASATKAGCAADYGDLQSCLADNAICDTKRKDLVVPVSACGAQVTRLLGCEFPVVPTGATTGAGAGGGSTTGSSM